MGKNTVDESLIAMYSNYYESDDILQKRKITAVQTLEHIQAVLNGHLPGKLLDVGCGEGSLMEQMSHKKFADKLYAVEVSKSGVETTRSKNIPELVEILEFDGYQIPYPDKFFDLAVSIHVLEHVEHERLFITELKRVSNHIVIEVPLEHTIRVSEAMKLGQQYGHINFYTVDTFANLLNTCGLKIEAIKVFPSSVELHKHMYGNFKGLLKYFLRKSALSIAPSLSTKFMTYLCTVYCTAA